MHPYLFIAVSIHSPLTNAAIASFLSYNIKIVSQYTVEVEQIT